MEEQQKQIKKFSTIELDIDKKDTENLIRGSLKYAHNSATFLQEIQMVFNELDISDKERIVGRCNQIFTYSKIDHMDFDTKGITYDYLIKKEKELQQKTGGALRFLTDEIKKLTKELRRMEYDHEEKLKMLDLKLLEERTKQLKMQELKTNVPQKPSVRYTGSLGGG